MIAIIDYGAGNIASVQKAFNHLGYKTKLTSDPSEIMNADAAILPGVGSFGDAMDNINSRGLKDTIIEFANSGKPFLGICLGLQLMFEKSEESPEAVGLGILKGEIVKIPTDKGLKVPHIGWNSLDINDSVLLKGLSDNSYVYFVHSYYLKAKEDIVIATADYGVEIHASVQKNNVFACQFHPEKSGDVGLTILKNFAELIEVK